MLKSKKKRIPKFIALPFFIFLTNLKQTSYCALVWLKGGMIQSMYDWDKYLNFKIKYFRKNIIVIDKYFYKNNKNKIINENINLYCQMILLICAYTCHMKKHFCLY